MDLDTLGERSDYKLLVACSRTTRDEEQALRVQELLRDEALHWGNLVTAAGYHGVQPLLYAHLRRMPANLLSTEHMTWLRGVVGARSAHSLVLVQELGRLVELLDRESIPFIVTKGPVLALEVYEELAMRPFADLDLVIDEADYSRIEAVLSADGYRSRAMSRFQKASYLFIHGQYSFWKRLASVGSASAFLDVHTAVMPPGYSYAEHFTTLVERAHTLRVGRAEVKALEPEDLLTVLCFHGFKSRWDRLKYVCDVAEVIRAYPQLDWDTVHVRMRSMHSQRILRLSLYLAITLLNAPVPEPVKGDVLADKRVIRLGQAVVERMPQQAYVKVEPYLDRVRFNIFGQDSMAGRVRYSAYAAARRISELYTPTSDD